MDSSRIRQISEFTLLAAIVALGGGSTVAQQTGSSSPAAEHAVVQIPRMPPVDQEAHDRGRALWARECVNCHGTQARGSENGPNIIRTRTVNFDRSSPTPGSVLGPFLSKGHETQSGRASASFSSDEVAALANFLRQRVNDTMRGSPVFTVGDILIGNPAAGKAFFFGGGKCAECHNETTNNLAPGAGTPGIGARIPRPVDLQQRMLFPTAIRGRETVTVTQRGETAVAGTLVEQSDFFVTLRLADGTLSTVRRTPQMKVVISNPLQAHIDLLEVITDAQMHDVVAYLEALK
jgi:mono/diheme cytochrome c family protein